MQNTKPRVLVADDEMALRVYIVAIVKDINCEVVGEAKDGQQAINLFKALRPDLTMLDINMPNKTGVEALKEIMAIAPLAKVVMLTSIVDSDIINDCIMAGASGFIRKDSPVDKIKALIKETMT